MDPVYLDHNATTRPAPEVVEAMRFAIEEGWANPSSIHRAGQAVRHRIDLARESVAALLGAASREIVFTSGGTEADNLALLGSVTGQRRAVATIRTEHSAIRASAEWLASNGHEVIWLELDEQGLVRLDAMKSLLAARADELAVVSVMWANNETGLVQPIEAIGALCREHGVRFHTDAVQWVGKMPTDLAGTPVDLLSFSAHKMHGPKGIGGLYVRRGVRINARAIGGGQERERRGGTENVPGILGLGAAADLALGWLAGDGPVIAERRRDEFERGLLAAIPDAHINAAATRRLWNTTNVGFPRLEAEALLMLFSERGLYASAGAACSSGSLEPSPVLLAMGVPPEVAHGSVRFSLARDTTDDEITRALEIIPDAIRKLRAGTAAVVR